MALYPPRGDAKKSINEKLVALFFEMLDNLIGASLSK
jgi:hypothetical protein